MRASKSGLNTNKLRVGFESWGVRSCCCFCCYCCYVTGKRKSFFSQQKICPTPVPPSHKNYFTFSLWVWGRRGRRCRRWFLTEKKRCRGGKFKKEDFLLFSPFSFQRLSNLPPFLLLFFPHHPLLSSLVEINMWYGNRRERARERESESSTGVKPIRTTAKRCELKKEVGEMEWSLGCEF